MNHKEFAVYAINDFMVTYRQHYEAMVHTNHFSIQYGYFNNYHVGESVWTHTMMVMSHALVKLESTSYIEEAEYKEIILAILLHDIGKPGAFAIDHERGKVTFHGHEQLSTTLAVDVLMDYLNKNLIDKNTMVNVLYLINQHTLFYDLDPNRLEGKSFRKLMRKINPQLVRQLLFLRVVDMLGNISTKQEIRSEVFDNDTLADDLVLASMAESYGNIEYDNTLPMLTMMVGIPGAGKSYYLADSHVPVLSRDAIVEELAPEWLYNEAFKIVDQDMVEELFENRLNKLISLRASFVVDKTNLTRKSRNKILNRVKGKYNVQFKVLLTPYRTILDRNIDRVIEGKRIPDHVMDMMSKNFTLPQMDEVVGMSSAIQFITPKD